MKNYLFTLFICWSLYANKEPLVVGTTSGYAPYVSIDLQGNYEGFDIDFARALADKLDYQLVVKDCGTMPNLLMALKQNKVDLVIWAVSITEKRKKSMEMVYYQGPKVTEMPLLFWKNVPGSLISIDDVVDRSMVIAVEAGSFQEDIVLRYPNGCVKQVDGITEAIMEVRFGKADVALVDPSLVSRLLRQYTDLKVVYASLPPDMSSLGNGVCIAKEKVSLISKVQNAVEELTKEGKICELEAKWQLEGK